MATKTHAIVAFLFCLATSAAIFTKTIQVIGLFHGPSAEINALKKQRSVQTKILSLTGQNEETWPWDDVFEDYQNRAYQDDRALVFRDAGLITSSFALVLAIVSQITPIFYTVSQRFYLLLSALALYIIPGLIGQIYQKAVPIEIVLLKTCGLTKGLTYIGYCSMRSLSIGMGFDGPYSAYSLLHDLKVVMLARFLAYVVLG